MRMLLYCAFAVAIAGQAVAAETRLPEPNKVGGPTLFQAIDNRSSEILGSFPMGEVGQEELATILWAASGHNREGKLWTVPMAIGRPPYCKIYVAADNGVFLYDWSAHSLVEVSADNVKAEIPMQEMVKRAPMTLYVVTDGEMLAKMNNPMSDEFGLVLAGAMSQNIYLACQGVGVGTRVIYSIHRDKAKELLKLHEADTPLFAMPIGKK